jgi:triosephosphate isomerase
MSPRPIFLGNWKMNMLQEEVQQFAESFLEQFDAIEGHADCGFAAPTTSLHILNELFNDVAGVRLGAQNVHWLESGAHTGEISAKMLLEHNVDFVIVGHSERRQFYGESSENVALRAKSAIEHGLTAVVCVGESKEDYESGRTKEVVRRQLYASTNGITPKDCEHLIIAYEPIWAIGTGLAATPEAAGGVHDLIRVELQERFGSERGAAIPLLYGGSTKPDNIRALMDESNINGALVGGVSLLPDGFSALIENGRD